MCYLPLYIPFWVAMIHFMFNFWLSNIEFEIVGNEVGMHTEYVTVVAKKTAEWLYYIH